ncbi:hypothetical protein QIG66_27995, partial [Klebsiella pneumoniae]|nr:hypothetical protein [Klebsiella pneumoniae]
HGNKISSNEGGGNSESSRLSNGVSADLAKNLGSTLTDVLSKSSEFGVSSSTGTSYNEAYSNLQTASKQFSEA